MLHFQRSLPINVIGRAALLGLRSDFGGFDTALQLRQQRLISLTPL
jgi:hypothetical protein